MPSRSTFFRAATAFVFVGVASPAFAQPLGDMYVRLDLGWGGATNANIHNRDQPVVNPLATVSGINGTVSDIGSAWIVGAGAGMRFLPNIRADLTYTYRGGYSLDDTDQGAPPNRFQADIHSNSVMATAYWDFPVATYTVAFFGLGLGWADVSMSNLTSNTALMVNPHIAPTGVALAPDGRTDNFAWQLAAGVGFPVGNGMMVDLFYRYFDGGHVQTPAGNVTVNGSTIGTYGGAEGALHSHELAVSVRVPLT